MNTAKVEWRMLLNTKNSVKANKTMKLIEEVLGELSIHCCEPYWKEKRLYDLQFATVSSVSDAGEAALKLMAKASYLSSAWNFRMPPMNFESYENVSLFGVADENIRIPGVTWISCDMQVWFPQLSVFNS